MNPIYLDANSTTQMDDRVRQAMLECYEAGYMNPASQHQPGQRARRQIEMARSSIVNSLGAGPKDRLIFTSGGTEANNLAIIGLMEAFANNINKTANATSQSEDEKPELIVSSVEHPSVLGAADFLTSQGFVQLRMAVDHSGHALTETLPDLFVPQTRLVSLMMVNNETGMIQDLSHAAELCREEGVLLHTDAVQAVGKIPVNFGEMGVSALTLTAHKLHGPRGIGGLLLAEGVETHPILFGGFQQLGQRPGTEDVALAVGFAKAVELAVDSLEERSRQLCEMRDLFEATILETLPETKINGIFKNFKRPRVPHTSNLSFPGYVSGNDEFSTVNRQALLMAVDAAGVAISTGSACASGSSDPSHVLQAMCLSKDIVESSIRVSFSVHNTRLEVLEGARRIINAVKHLRQQKSSRK